MVNDLGAKVLEIVRSGTQLPALKALANALYGRGTGFNDITEPGRHYTNNLTGAYTDEPGRHFECPQNKPDMDRTDDDGTRHQHTDNTYEGGGYSDYYTDYSDMTK